MKMRSRHEVKKSSIKYLHTATGGAEQKHRRRLSHRSATGQQTAKDTDCTTQQQDAHSQQQHRLTGDSFADISHIADNGSHNELKISKQRSHGIGSRFERAHLLSGLLRPF